MLTDIGEAVPVREGYLVGEHQISENVGYPRVPVPPVLRAAEDLLQPEIGGEELWLVTARAQDGLMLEYETYVIVHRDYGYRGYELTIWGAFAEALRR
jgi:hypothetical protein